MTRTRSIFVLGLTLLAAGLSSGQIPGPDPVRVTLDLPAEEVRPGGTFEVGVVFAVESGYHIYGPTETRGIPTTAALEAPAGWTVGPAAFPPAKETDYPGLGGKLMLYEGRIVVKFPVTVPAGASAGPGAVTAVVGWQACTETQCLIPKKGIKIRGEVRVAAGGSAQAALPVGASVRARVGGSTAEGAASPVGESERASVGASTTAEMTPPVGALERGRVGGSTTAGAASPVGESERASVGASAETTDTPPTAPGNRFAEALGRGRLLALLIAFWAGLLADASGCVFPLIPLTLAFFANQADKRRGAVVALAVTYTLGMTATYATIGVIAGLAARDLGSFFNHPAGQITVAAIFGALALSFFGLYEIRLPSALADRFGGTQKRGLPGAFFMGMTLGFVATPCVGPFAAAILAYVATTGDAWLGFFALAAFGFGMGLPFMILGMFSSDVVRRMLRAGEWLDHVKRFCGFLMLAMALFFLRTRLPELVLFGAGGVIAVLWAVSFGALNPVPIQASWWLRLGRACMALLLINGSMVVGLSLGAAIGWVPRMQLPGLVLFGAGGILAVLWAVSFGALNPVPIQASWWLRLGRTCMILLYINGSLVVGLSLATAAGWVPAPAIVGSMETIWETDFEAGLARAKREGKPVLVDFWSDTCIPCMELKKNEFRDPRFAEEAKRFVLVAVDVSDTEGPQFDLKIKRFKSYALPFIGFIDGAGRERRELFFEEKPSLERLIDHMRKVR